MNTKVSLCTRALYLYTPVWNRKLNDKQTLATAPSPAWLQQPCTTCMCVCARQTRTTTSEWLLGLLSCWQAEFDSFTYKRKNTRLVMAQCSWLWSLCTVTPVQWTITQFVCFSCVFLYFVFLYYLPCMERYKSLYQPMWSIINVINIKYVFHFSLYTVDKVDQLCVKPPHCAYTLYKRYTDIYMEPLNNHCLCENIRCGFFRCPEIRGRVLSASLSNVRV